MISALLFRETSGRQSLRETSEIFGLSRARLNEWEHALKDVLPRILRKLRLAPGTPRMGRMGGPDWRRRYAGVFEDGGAGLTLMQ